MVAGVTEFSIVDQGAFCSAGFRNRPLERFLSRCLSSRKKMGFASKRVGESKGDGDARRWRGDFSRSVLSSF